VKPLVVFVAELVAIYKNTGITDTGITISKTEADQARDRGIIHAIHTPQATKLVLPAIDESKSPASLGSAFRSIMTSMRSSLKSCFFSLLPV
jgi:hypothetical protein